VKPWMHTFVLTLGWLLCALFAGKVIWSIAELSADRGASHRERCKKFRREFFESCIALEPRYRCEAQWAQLEGKVFDSSPELPWADQLDCSKDFE